MMSIAIFLAMLVYTIVQLNVMFTREGTSINIVTKNDKLIYNSNKHYLGHK